MSLGRWDLRRRVSRNNYWGLNPEIRVMTGMRYLPSCQMCRRGMSYTHHTHMCTYHTDIDTPQLHTHIHRHHTPHTCVYVSLPRYITHERLHTYTHITPQTYHTRTHTYTYHSLHTPTEKQVFLSPLST